MSARPSMRLLGINTRLAQSRVVTGFVPGGPGATAAVPGRPRASGGAGPVDFGELLYEDARTPSAKSSCSTPKDALSFARTLEADDSLPPSVWKEVMQLILLCRIRWLYFSDSLVHQPTLGRSNVALSLGLMLWRFMEAVLRQQPCWLDKGATACLEHVGEFRKGMPTQTNFLFFVPKVCEDA